MNGRASPLTTGVQTVRRRIRGTGSVDAKGGRATTLGNGDGRQTMKVHISSRAAINSIFLLTSVYLPRPFSPRRSRVRIHGGRDPAESENNTKLVLALPARPIP